MLSEEKVERVLVTLRYTSQPTMAWTSQGDILDFIQNEASDKNVRNALATVVWMAQQLLLDLERP